MMHRYETRLSQLGQLGQYGEYRHRIDSDDEYRMTEHRNRLVVEPISYDGCCSLYCVYIAYIMAYIIAYICLYLLYMAYVLPTRN